MRIERVVADASPLIILFKSGLIHLLPQLFNEIVVTATVRQEVAAGGSADPAATGLARAAWAVLTLADRRMDWASQSTWLAEWFETRVSEWCMEQYLLLRCLSAANLGALLQMAPRQTNKAGGCARSSLPTLSSRAPPQRAPAWKIQTPFSLTCHLHSNCPGRLIVSTPPRVTRRRPRIQAASQAALCVTRQSASRYRTGANLQAPGIQYFHDSQ